ncbi:MAG: MBG domain-containing protein, partial [Bacteroidaceae bacterium]|nr:MBG domain-containing protein [Bacteroidaceae bacterium]
VGTYPIVVSKGGVTNYNDSYVNGTLTVTKAPLTITAQDYVVKQGEPLPAFDVSYEGFKNGETADVLTEKPAIACAATSSSVSGTYEIVVSGAEAENYEMTYVAGTLTIEKTMAIPLLEENTEVSFEESITKETDLTDTVVDNVYVTLDTEADDGYDTAEKCIVLASVVTEEQMETIVDKDVKDETVKENYNGLIFAVPIGKGVIRITAQTKGNRMLSVKVGDAEAQTFVQPERGEIEVPYTATESTYVYIYGADTSAGAQRRVSGSETENGVLIYGIKWEGVSTDVDAITTANEGTYQIYTIDGTPVKVLQKGVNIIRYSDGTSKKVYVK